MAHDRNGLRSPTIHLLLILTSLAESPKHGHALAKDIEAFAGVVLDQALSTAPSPGSKSAV